MTTTEANNILRNTMRDLIVKMGATQNESKIMAMTEAYINECQINSNYDQVANVNSLVSMVSKGDIKSFLGAIQYKDTLCHINRI